MVIDHKDQAEKAISDMRELLAKEQELIQSQEESLPAYFIQKIKEIHHEKLICLGLFHWAVEDMVNKHD